MMFVAADIGSIKSELDNGVGYVVADRTDLLATSVNNRWAELERIGHALGCLLPQDHTGGHRHEIRVDDRISTESQRIFPTNSDEFEYHTDGSYLYGGHAVQYVLLWCQQAAAVGGETLLLPAELLVDWLQTYDHHAFETLEEPMPFLVDRELAGAPENDVLWAPAVWCKSLRYHVRIHRWRMSSSRSLSGRQGRALESLGQAFHAITDSPAFVLMPGSLLILNNARVLHARKAFKDADGSVNRRTLLRLWIGVAADT